MVLTDDNFATIVSAVRQGRDALRQHPQVRPVPALDDDGRDPDGVLRAAARACPSPSTPLQILWVAMIMDGPPAVSLALDAARPGIMERTAARVATSRCLPLSRLGAVVAFGIDHDGRYAGGAVVRDCRRHASTGTRRWPSRPSSCSSSSTCSTPASRTARPSTRRFFDNRLLVVLAWPASSHCKRSPCTGVPHSRCFARPISRRGIGHSASASRRASCGWRSAERPWWDSGVLLTRGVPETRFTATRPSRASIVPAYADGIRSRRALERRERRRHGPRSRDMRRNGVDTERRLPAGRRHRIPPFVGASLLACDFPIS